MKNEVQLKPLLKYEVHYRTCEGLVIDVFTADELTPTDLGVCFKRTGNIIRVYQVPLEKVVITPVAGDEEIPA